MPTLRRSTAGRVDSDSHCRRFDRPVAGEAIAMSDLREALKPCPFCGGNDIRFDKHHSYNYSHPDFKFHWSMCCYNCGATFPNRYRKELLVAAWNTRAALAQPEAVEPVAYLHSGDFKEGAAEDVQYFEVTVSLYPAVGFDVPIYTTPPLAPDERMRRALEIVPTIIEQLERIEPRLKDD